jgi:PAS domain S-box-containing protein
MVASNLPFPYRAPMNLSRKIILVIVSTFIALIFIVAATSDIILLKNFRLIEKGNVLSHTQQVRNLIKDREQEIDVTSRDFSSGLEELLQRGMSPALIDQRFFSEKNLKSHLLDLAAVYDADGRRMFIRAIDCDKGTYCDIGLEKQHALDAVVTNLKVTADTHFSGTVNIGGEPLMVSIQPLKASDGTLRGLSVVGCFLDRDELDHIFRVTGYNAVVAKLASGPLPPDVAVANAELQQGGEIVARVLSDDSVSGYFHLKDISAKPSFIVNVSEKRIFFDQGKAIIAYIVGTMIVCSGVFCGVMLIFIRGAVLKRLATLSATVEEISKKRDISARLAVRGEDELEVLAGSINTMLASLESAELSLKESEERYRALFERAPDSIFIISIEGDEVGRIVDANLAACDQHGYCADELRAMRIQDLNTPESSCSAGALIERISQGEWVTEELWHIRKDGSRFPLEIHAGPVKLGGSSYILGFDRDITSRKLADESDRMYLEQIRQLNAELGRQAANLELANRELETFNYSVSHDMRGPLTRISGYCQLMLEDDSGIDPQTRIYLSRIYDSSCWLDEMIAAMLKLAQLARAEFAPEPVNLTAICQEQLIILHQEEPGRVVEVKVAPGVTVFGDESLLKILMANLINNAWKYSSRSGQARIEFGVMTDGSSPVFFVRDNGIGFDMKDVDKLFRVFTRLHDPTQYTGNGIGLATAQRIIARHGGRIWAEGEVGRGATFFFTLTPDVQPV